MPHHDLTTVDTLLALDGTEFVESAYAAILRRPGDDEGRTHYLQRLYSGTAKADILVQIATSREGRAAGARIAGLDRWISRYKLAAVPLIGWLFAHDLVVDRKSPQARQVRVLQQKLYALHRELRETRLGQQTSADRAALTFGVALDKLGQAQTSAIDQLSRLVVQTSKNLDARIDLLARQVSDDMARLAETASRPPADARALAETRPPAAPAETDPGDRNITRNPLGKLRATLDQLRERGRA